MLLYVVSLGVLCIFLLRGHFSKLIILEFLTLLEKSLLGWLKTYHLTTDLLKESLGKVCLWVTGNSIQAVPEL